jgi:hypothetical protein
MYFYYMSFVVYYPERHAISHRKSIGNINRHPVDDDMTRSRL